jgi:hypothetical protein
MALTLIRRKCRLMISPRNTGTYEDAAFPRAMAPYQRYDDKHAWIRGGPRAASTEHQQWSEGRKDMTLKRMDNVLIVVDDL